MSTNDISGVRFCPWKTKVEMLWANAPVLCVTTGATQRHSLWLVCKFIRYYDTEFYHNFRFQPYPWSSLWADLLRSSLWWKKCFVYSVILKLLFLATTILVCSCPMKALHHSNTMSQMYENIVSPREGVCLECSCYKVFPAYLHLIPLHYTNINTCRWIHCWTAHSGNASASTQHIHTQCHPIHQR